MQLAQFKLVYTDFLPRRLSTRLLGADATGCGLVGFCFSETECFTLQILLQTINTLSALDKPALNTFFKLRVFERSGHLFILPFLFCRSTDPTLANHIDEKCKNKWPNGLRL